MAISMVMALMRVRTTERGTDVHLESVETLDEGEEGQPPSSLLRLHHMAWWSDLRRDRQG